MGLGELLADAVGRLSTGPLRVPIELVVASLQTRDPIKLARLALLTAFCVPALWSQSAWAFQLNHMLMVWFHEAGHGLFWFTGGGPIGHFLISLGGSLVQCLVPAMFMVAALSIGKRFDASTMFLWLGLNLVDVSIYAGDAQARALPLIFNLDKDSHDWYNILGALNLLWATPVIAGAIWSLGLLCYVAAAVCGVMTAERD